MENKGGPAKLERESEGKSENWQGKTTAFKNEQIKEFPPRVHRGAATLPDRPSGWKGRARAGNGRSLCVARAGQGQSQGGDGRQGGGERFGHVPPTTAIIETVETFKLLKPCPPSSRTF